MSTISSIKTKPLIIAYGSLRARSSRGHNHNRFGANSQRFIRMVTLPGYDLYSIAGGAYPAVTKGDGTLIAELHEVTQDAFDLISEMETGSGYVSEPVEIDGKVATIYTMAANRLKGRCPKVESGDWD